jgi:hypothetical protein
MSPNKTFPPERKVPDRPLTVYTSTHSFWPLITEMRELGWLQWVIADGWMCTCTFTYFPPFLFSMHVFLIFCNTYICTYIYAQDFPHTVYIHNDIATVEAIVPSKAYTHMYVYMYVWDNVTYISNRLDNVRIRLSLVAPDNAGAHVALD